MLKTQLSQTRSHNQLHALYSMLPKEYTLYPKQEVKKTKDFYKPQQFIWNNPHRTSDRLYKYYHKGVDEYKRVKEPLIVQQENHDRQIRQSNRIRNLSQKRQETRSRFHSKQLERLNLQNRSGIMRDSAAYFISQVPTSILSKNSSSASSQLTSSILRRSNSESLRVTPNKTPKHQFLYRNIKTVKQEEVSSNQRSYLQSVQNFDSKTRALTKAIKKSQKQMKEEIRQNFMKQKENNHHMNASIYGIEEPKLVKTTFTKKKNLKFDFSTLSKKCPNNKSHLQPQRS